VASRFHRQEIMSEIGIAGQRRLCAATVAIVGLGGIGSVAAELLCRAGIGHLILIDDDSVQGINLHRQLLYSRADVGTRKSDAARERLLAIWPDAKVEARAVRLDEKTLPLLDAADVILDGTDNLATRFLVAKYARTRGRLFIYAGAVETRGMVFPALPTRDAPALEDVLPTKEPLQGCRDIGIITTTNVMTATLQALLAIRWFVEGTLVPTLYRIDGWSGTIEQIAVKARDARRRRPRK
jgi:molybdopterin/thiamine biosynthesis adenylyltransferase